MGVQDDGTYPLPPTPLSSLVKVSSNAVGGIVLTGYDDAFVAGSAYHSHLDSISTTSGSGQDIDRDAIAYAATLLARTAGAAAYQDGDYGVDAATADADGERRWRPVASTTVYVKGLAATGASAPWRATTPPST